MSSEAIQRKLDTSGSLEFTVNVENNEIVNEQIRTHSNVFVANLGLILSVFMYCFVSLSIVYYNWWLFTKSSLQYPIFISWAQQVFGALCFYILALLGLKIKIFSNFPLKCLTIKTLIHVLPLTLTFIGMVGSANLCLKYTQVSTYQVARGLTIFATMGASFIILGERQSFLVILSCFIMVIGFAIGSSDTTTLSVKGCLTGVAASCFQGLYNVIIKHTLKSVDNDPNILLLYNLLISSVLFIPIVFLFNEGEVFMIFSFSKFDKQFLFLWGALFLSGFLASALNLTAYWCVRISSPLTFNIVGFSKSVVQSLGSILFLGDLVTLYSLLGLSLSVSGSGLYSYFKYKELEKNKIFYQEIENTKI